MNALTPILHAVATQTELFAARDILDAIIEAGATPLKGPARTQYAFAGDGFVKHRSGRRFCRDNAIETLALHRGTATNPDASPAFKVAAEHIAKHLERAIELAWPELKDA